MNEENPINNLLKNLSESYSRLYQFIKSPKIEINKNIFSNTMADFVISFSIVFFIIQLLKELLPDYLSIKPLELLNVIQFGFMLATNVFLLAFIFCILFWLLNKIRRIDNISLIFYQVIKTYSIMNIFIVVIFTILLDKILTNNTTNWTLLESFIAIGLTIAVLYMFYRLLLKPIAVFLTTYFSKKTSYIISIASIFIALNINQPIFTKYFINVIDKEEICKQYVELNFQQDITDMKKNKDCMIGKCLKEFNNYFK